MRISISNLYIILIGLLFTLCTPQSSNSVSPASKKCFLTKYSVTGSGTKTTRTFFYNQNDQLVNVQYRDENNAIISIDSIIYDVNRRLTGIRTYRSNGVLIYDFSFSYTGAGDMPGSIVSYRSEFTPPIINTLLFNQQKQLIRQTTTANYNQTDTLEYDSDQNLKSVTASFLLSRTPASVKSMIVNRTDQSINPWGSSVSLQLWFLCKIGSNYAFSKSNPANYQLVNSYTFNNNNTLTTGSMISNNTYLTNEWNYPVSQTEKTDAYSFSYAYEYTCK